MDCVATGRAWWRNLLTDGERHRLHGLMGLPMHRIPAEIQVSMALALGLPCVRGCLACRLRWGLCLVTRTGLVELGAATW